MAKPDPRKLKDEAQEAVSKGRWKKALEVYRELEKVEPKDGTWAQKAGDMYRRLGQKPESVAAFQRAAEVFSATGFLLKAIACCKIVLEIDPSHTDTQAKLAALHAQRGAHAAAPTQAVAALPMARGAQLSPGPRPVVPPPAPAAPSASALALEAGTSAFAGTAAPRAAPPPTSAPRAPFALLDLEAPPPPPPASAPGLPPRTRSLPPGLGALDQVSLGKVMPGARRSQEISAVSEAAAYEIPLDDSLDAAFGQIGASGPAAAAGANLAAPSAAPEDPAIELTVDVSGLSADVASAAAGEAAEVFPRTPLFSFLDEARLRVLIERARLVHLEAGECAFKKGDPGDALYVVAEGEVAVLGGESSDVELARLGEGAFFGEIALVARQSRSATVAATMATDLIAVDAEVLFDLVADEPEVLKVILRFLRDRLLALLVETSPLFAPFSGAERFALAARFRFIEAEPNAQIVVQGQKAAGLFILLSGRASVTLDGAPVAELGAGELFGEMSLLAHGLAAATIHAATACYLLELPRADFSELIMTHPQVLEHLSALADERKQLLAEFRAGRATYREGRLRVL
jgi:CRP-like cAMP-binding protein